MGDSVSNCCGAYDTCTTSDGPSYGDIGICPDCREHCDFVDEDDLCEECGEENCTLHIQESDQHGAEV